MRVRYYREKSRCADNMSNSERVDIFDEKKLKRR